MYSRVGFARSDPLFVFSRHELACDATRQSGGSIDPMFLELPRL